MGETSLHALQRRVRDAVKGSPLKAPVAGRMAVYRYAYRARIEESLVEDFPRLRARIGRRAFSELVTSFLSGKASRYASLAEVSARMPEHLARSRLGRAKPWLVELARFEWQLIRARVSADLEAFDFSVLGAWSESELQGMRVRFHPEFRLFQGSWTFLSRAPVRGECKVAVFKNGHESGYRKISERQWLVLDAIARGRPLSAVAGILARKSAGRVSEKEIMRWFSEWVARGWIYRVDPGEERRGSRAKLGS